MEITANILSTAPAQPAATRNTLQQIVTFAEGFLFYGILICGLTAPVVGAIIAWLN